MQPLQARSDQPGKGDGMTWDEQDRIRNERVALAAGRLQMREQKALWARLRDAENRFRMISSAPASQIREATSSRKPESKPPPHCEDIDILPRMDQVKHAILVLEEVLDAYLGLSPARDFKTLTTSELDAEVLKWEGVESWKVAAYASYLGRTPRTIENARRRLGKRPTDGRPLVKREEGKAA